MYPALIFPAMVYDAREMGIESLLPKYANKLVDLSDQFCWMQIPPSILILLEVTVWSSIPLLDSKDPVR